MSVQVAFKSSRQRLSERIKVLSISTSVDRDGYPEFAGTICWIGVCHKQFRSIVLWQVVAAVDAVELSNMSSNYAIDLPILHLIRP